MNVDRWLAVLGLIGTVIGFVLAYYLYVKTIKTKRLAYAYTQPVSLRLPLHSSPSSFHESVIESRHEPSRVLLLLWNRGTAPIEKSDFVEPIKVLPTSSILHVEAHEQNSAAAATVVNEEISIELLRPNEAIIFSIDAIEPDFTPEISIVMKSADMSEFLRSAPVNIRNVIPIVAAIATFLLVAGIFIWSAVSFDLRSVLSTDVLAWGTVLLAFGLAYLVHKFVRRSLLWGTFHLPAKFFQMQKTCAEINRSWKWLQKESRDLMAMG